MGLEVAVYLFQGKASRKPGIGDHPVIDEVAVDLIMSSDPFSIVVPRGLIETNPIVVNSWKVGRESFSLSFQNKQDLIQDALPITESSPQVNLGCHVLLIED